MLNDNNKIDRFFRESIQNYETNDSSDLLWERLENNLSKLQEATPKADNIKTVHFVNKKTKYLYFATAAAVILLIFIAGNKFLNIDLFDNSENSKEIISNNIISKNITNKNNDNYSENNIYNINTYIIDTNSTYFTTNNNNTSTFEILNFHLLKYKKYFNKNVINIAQYNNNTDNNKKTKNNISLKNKEKRDNTYNNFVADNNISATQENSINNIAYIQNSGSNGSNSYNSINQSNLEQQLEVSINNISRISVRDSVKITEAKEREKKQEDIKEIKLQRNEILMKENFGIDTSNSQEIQELKLNAENHTHSLVFPNVFTPNNDGINDCFTILGIEECAINQLVIKDRLGKTVYETINYYNNWEARNVVDGVYYFIFVCKTPNNDFVKKGIVTIIR